MSDEVRFYKGKFMVKVLIPMYEPLQVSKCKKCEKVIAEPKELFRIVR